MLRILMVDLSLSPHSCQVFTVDRGSKVRKLLHISVSSSDLLTKALLKDLKVLLHKLSIFWKKTVSWIRSF